MQSQQATKQRWKTVKLAERTPVTRQTHARPMKKQDELWGSLLSEYTTGRLVMFANSLDGQDQVDGLMTHGTVSAIL